MGAAVVKFLPALIPLSKPPESDGGSVEAMQDLALDASTDFVLHSTIFWQGVRSSLMVSLDIVCVASLSALSRKHVAQGLGVESVRSPLEA